MDGFWLCGRQTDSQVNFFCPGVLWQLVPPLHSAYAHTCCSRLGPSGFGMREVPWSNNRDSLLSEAERNDCWWNNQSEVCSQMGGPCWPLAASLSTWRQPRSCTDLGTSAACNICMLPHWHLEQWHEPCSVVPPWVPLRKTVEHHIVLFIACSWWRWHTQHRSLWRLDLVTSCLFLVSWIHLAVGTKLSTVMLKSLPSMANATVPMSEKSISAVRSRESEIAPSNFLQNLILKTLHKKAHCLLQLIPKEGEHNLWNQFLYGLTSRYFCSSGIPPSRNPKKNVLHLLVGCQPLPKIP